MDDLRWRVNTYEVCWHGLAVDTCLCCCCESEEEVEALHIVDVESVCLEVSSKIVCVGELLSPISSFFFAWDESQERG